MNKFNELYESLMNEASPKTVANELAKALNAKAEKDKNADHEVYRVWSVSSSSSGDNFELSVNGDNISLELGKFNGNDKILVKGIGRRMGYDVDID